VPTSANAVLILIVFVMPGFICGRVVSFSLPDSEPSNGRLLLTAISLSCLNYAVLSGLLVLAWEDSWYSNPLALAGVTFFTLFITPILIGLLIPWVVDTRWGRHLRGKLGLIHPVPKAWDYFFRSRKPCWVFATLKSGRLIAGWYGMNSFASSFPAEEDLYLEKMCKLTTDGKIQGIDQSSVGAIIKAADVESLELFQSS
jgi:hypothetical protein